VTARLTKKLVNEYFVNEANAQWAIETWMYALEYKDAALTTITARFSDELHTTQHRIEISPPLTKNTTDNIDKKTHSIEASLKRGQVVDGMIVATAPTHAIVEVNGLHGVIPNHELEKMNKATLDQLQEGATIPVFVVNPRGQDGLAVLSVNRAM